jgi:hypothetical protein
LQLVNELDGILVLNNESEKIIMSSDSQTQDILKWLNNHRHEILLKYPNQYIAYNQQGIITHSENLQEVLQQAKASGEIYLIYLVPSCTASVQILPIRFSSVVRHEWQPNYKVKFKHNEIEIETNILVDSGAEISLISLKLGQDLGYKLADAESTLVAQTIGGQVEYVLRNVEMTIDGHSFTAPLAWLQEKTGGEQLLLGREVVFDRFDIEFRQADEQIIFKWRNK